MADLCFHFTCMLILKYFNKCTCLNKTNQDQPKNYSLLCPLRHWTFITPL